MSMQHKAFLFDTEGFEGGLWQVITAAAQANDPELVCGFIDGNLERCMSPYSEDTLDENWRDELGTHSLQEVCDFALTSCYDISDDRGLIYSWDALLETMKRMDWRFRAGYYVLGDVFQVGDFELDPGQMGTGFVMAADVAAMHGELLENKGKFLEIAGSLDEDADILYELTDEELKEAYDDLISLYESAAREGKGLMLTF